MDHSLCFICVICGQKWMGGRPSTLHPASCIRVSGGSVHQIVEELGQAGAITIAEFFETGADAFHHLR